MDVMILNPFFNFKIFYSALSDFKIWKPIVKEKAKITDEDWNFLTENNEFLKIRNKFQERRQIIVGKGMAS